MTQFVPWFWEMLRLSFVDSDRADLGEGSKLRATSGSALQPDQQGNVLAWVFYACMSRWKQVVEHATFSCWVIPIDFLVTYRSEKKVPE